MAISTAIGLNFTKISDYNISIDIPSKTSNLIPVITQTANNITGNNLGYIILSAIAIILYWVLSDSSQFAEFRYSSGRSLNIVLGVCSVIGLSMLEAGFFTSFKAVAMFVVLYILSFIFVLSYENKE